MQAERPPILTPTHIEEAARLFGILAEPARLRLLKVLMEGERTVGELVRETGLKQGNVSKHLAVLWQARLVARTPRGNFAVYRLLDPLLRELCTLVCRRLDAGHARGDSNSRPSD